MNLVRLLVLVFLFFASSAFAQSEPQAPRITADVVRPHILVDLTADRVLSAEAAFAPWHPASLTKMMTTYTVLDMMRAGEIGPDTKVMMTWWAAEQSPSKMGFKPGTLIPLRDALAMIAVKSANDVSQAIAESVTPGAPEDFAARMNANARKLGMTSSYFVNPHGLHHPDQVTSARDMALLVRALRREFDDWMWLWKTPAIRTVKSAENPKPRTYRSFNALLGRFRGADGMKTGFVCASGFNIVNTATRTMDDGTERTVLSVVLGAPSQEKRAETSAELMENGFAADPAGLPTLETLEPYGDTTTRTNLRSQICTEAARANRYDGRDVEGRMVLDTDLITPRTRAPLTVRIEPQPPMPLPQQKPASLGGPADDGIEYAYGTPVPLTRPDDIENGETPVEDTEPKEATGEEAKSAPAIAVESASAVDASLAARAAPLASGVSGQ